MLDDRIRVFGGRPQRYGTQYDWNDDGSAMIPMVGVDDPDAVDKRQRTVGLPPIAWSHPPPHDESPPNDIAAHRAALDTWARPVGWR